MRITSLSGTGVLSFDQFKLDVTERLTTVVGPNGAGKSNLARLLEICRRAIECADGAVGDVDRMLASFLAAQHVYSRSPAIEARIAVKMTDDMEKGLVVEFVRALLNAAIVGTSSFSNMAEIDGWAAAEITEDKLLPLMDGAIVASHPGTEDGRWQCSYEFTAPDHDGSPQRYQWILLGNQPGAIIVAGHPLTGGSTLIARITGSHTPPPGPTLPVPGSFNLLDLLPHSGLPTMGCTFELSQRASESQRRFPQMTALSLINPGGGRTASLATVLRVIFRRALVQTSDSRLLPSGGISWSSSELALTQGAEARLPEFLVRLKNGEPSERARYQRIRNLFTEFTQGRACEVRLQEVPQPAGQDGQPSAPAHMPSIWVTVGVAAAAVGLVPEIPIEFAGAGAWEALFLASVLAEQAASVVVLDPPAVALHPSLQRQLGAYLQTTLAQFFVITHSSELLPLGPAANAQIIRLDRDATSATKAWTLDEACRRKMSKKLVAKGNERLPFAWRGILCEGEDDVGAVIALSDRMGIDLRRRNVAITDCGSRENLPDYMWFCSQLGLKYLAIMDADQATPGALPKAQAVRDTAARHGGGELVEFPENLEATFGVRKQKPSLVPDTIRAMPFTNGVPDPAHAPAEVIALAEAILRLVA